MAPRILIFSMAMGANYSFELISIETYEPQFIEHSKLFVGRVYYKASYKPERGLVVDCCHYHQHQKLPRVSSTEV